MISFCKGCGNRFDRHTSNEKKFCSTQCKLLNPKLPKGCKPRCKEATLRVDPVIFKDGTKHFRQHCKICCASRFINKKEGHKTIKEISVIENRGKILDRKYGSSFYSTREWLQVRYRALSRYGNQCMICKDTQSKMHVDHIKPRMKYPELALQESNLQVLCEACNIGKGAWDETDWRD